MMELQTLQEALKVEIQVHQKLVAQMKQDPQNADLKKQLHELQAKIMALSDKQKKVVEQLRKELLVKQEPENKLQADGKTLLLAPICPSAQTLAAPPHHQGAPQKTLTVTPVITAKTLPLVLKAATSTLPASMATQRPTVAMVTAISNPARPAANPDSLSTPIKLPNQDADTATRIVSKNLIVVQATTTTTTSAQPIKVPQFVPPPRLTPRPTLQPQVRPKPPAPNNVPIAPAPPPPMVAAPLIQRPLLLATKLTSSLPPSAGPIHQVRIVNGQQCAAIDKTGAAVTGIVIGPAQTLQITNLNSDAKTVKLQAVQEQVAVGTPPSSSPPLPPPPVKAKREESPQKLAFMVSLGLVTHDHLEEIQSRRQERKRRTTANPVYSGAVFEPERKKSAVTYLNTPLHQGSRKRGRPPKYSTITTTTTTSTTTTSSSRAAGPELGCHSLLSPASPAPERPDTGGFSLSAHPHSVPQPSPSSGDGDVHEDFCTVCRRSGQLLMCDTCSRVYHLDCLEPPLKNIPKGMWICPKCQDQILKKEEAIPWPGTLAIVHSYIAYKEAKEEEKLKLVKWSSELKLEREQLEQRVKQLSNSITKCMETKNSILARQKEMQVSLEKVKHLIRLIQSFNLSHPTETDTPPEPTQASVQDAPEPSVQVPAVAAALEVKAEPEVGEMAEPGTAVTPEASSLQPGLTQVPEAGIAEEAMDVGVTPEPVLRDEKSGGKADRLSRDSSTGAGDSPDSENIPPNGSTEDTSKTSLPSQQALPAPLSNTDHPK